MTKITKDEAIALYTKITKDEAIERITGVLKAAGIKAELGGCPCCGVFDVEFPDGAKVYDDSFWLKCDGISYQRG
jgi:hypothetical protein